MKIIIIGGVAGGATAAARLRRLNEKAEIIVIERGNYVSFANCGLPYYIGDVIKDGSNLTLQTPASLKSRYNLDVRVNSEVTKIDTERKTVTVKQQGSEPYEETYDKLLISTGAAPIIPNIEINGDNVFTLRNIPDTYKITSFIESNSPKTALVVGGGYIGVEMAENLAHRGIKVTVVERADHIIAPLDFDMAADVHRYLDGKIDLVLNTSVEKIDKNKVSLSNNKTIEADMVIMSVGVRPDTSLAVESKIETNSRGSILVDDHMHTSANDVWAVGDAVEVKNFVTGSPAFIPLAGPANRQGRIAADNICGGNSVYEGTQGSSVLKVFDMTVATTGINEQTAQKEKIDYDKLYIYSAPHATYYPGGINMSIKLLWEKTTEKILGAQIVGFSGVDKRADVIATAMRLGAKVTDLKKLELCYAPPFGNAKDPVNILGYAIENVISGRVKQFFWHDVDSLPRDGSVTLLDTRTPLEYSRGNINGFVNIPLDSLRENLSLIPKDKPVYVHCHSGMRSYIACMILKDNGYDCYNLSGGWRLYESVVNARTVKEYNCKECK